MESAYEIINNVNNENNYINSVNNVRHHKRKGYDYNINDVRNLAVRLMDKLNDDHSYLFFCKVAWNLPHHQIEKNLELALKGNNPRAYFTWLCKKQMQ